MNILHIHRYFWPDTPPYASTIRKIGERLIEEGHQVKIYSAQPSYKVEIQNEKRPRREKLGELEIQRCWLFREKSRGFLIRGVNSLLFVFQVFWHIVLQGKRYDIVTCSTMPPVILGWATSWACKLRGSKFIYHSMDIWPEVGAISGQIDGNSLKYKLLKRLDTAGCIRAAKIVCLSEDMKRSYVERDDRLADKIKIINNFDLPDYSESDVDVSGMLKQDGKFRVLFAGNLGKYQALETIIAAAVQLKDHTTIEFAFLGEGAMKETVKTIAEDNGLLGKTVVFYPHQPVTAAKTVMADADLCLVSLNPGVIGVAYPSKTMTYLVLGCPLCVVVEGNSELTQFVQKEKLGYASEPGDVDGLARNILDAFANREHLGATRENNRQVAARTVSVDVLLPVWVEFINSMANDE